MLNQGRTTHSILDLIEHRFDEAKDEVAQRYFFLDETSHLKHSDNAVHDLTVRTMWTKANAFAHHLDDLISERQRVLLLLPTCPEYVISFLGCLIVGAVPIPLSDDVGTRLTQRLKRIVDDAEPTVVVGFAKTLNRLKGAANTVPLQSSIEHWIDIDEVLSGAETWKEFPRQQHQLAYLQYTSGSTSEPKGVMVSHANLFDQTARIANRFLVQDSQTGKQRIVVSWLPLFHDMGLLFGLLTPLVGGAKVSLFPSSAFTKAPLRWLDVITAERAEVTVAPNFAYELCTQLFKQQRQTQIDLSTVKAAVVGAEPVNTETLDRFAATFKSCGFDSRAFHPGYGLAEATLGVSSGGVRKFEVDNLDRHMLQNGKVSPVMDRTESVTRVVGCGEIFPGFEVKVVNPETHRLCSDSNIGELWLRGPSVAMGYWNNPEATKEIFGAQLSARSETLSNELVDDKDVPRYLRTGDLGYVRDNVIFITGRQKDLIIVRGANHYPQDIENCVSHLHATFRPFAAAFSLSVANQEKLVVVQEVRSRSDAQTYETILASMRQTVAQEHELDLFGIVLVKGGVIPRTSSGKVQRRSCKQRFVDGSLPSIITDVPAQGSDGEAELHSLNLQDLILMRSSDREQAIVDHLEDLISHFLEIPKQRIDLSASLLAMGADSLRAYLLVSHLEQEFELEIPLSSLLNSTSVYAFASKICSEMFYVASDVNTEELEEMKL